MSSKSSRAPAPPPPPPPPPSPAVILAAYVALGAALSFLAGRQPGTLPDDVGREVAPAVLVVCGFLVSYSVFDVMAVGVARARHRGLMEKPYEDAPQRMPEDVYLAQRVQTNQVEQLTGFVVGSLSCAVLVDGAAAGLMALLWAALRRRYASAYRGASGVPLGEIGLARYTVPAYFLVNSMLAASAVHALRAIVASSSKD